MDIEHIDGPDGEEWVYGEGDDALMVDVISLGDDAWQVSVSAAEFVREEPLESRLRSAVIDAITSVEGVETAYEEDREVWSVEGTPDAETLVRAVATALEAMADELRAHIAAL